MERRALNGFSLVTPDDGAFETLDLQSFTISRHKRAECFKNYKICLASYSKFGTARLAREWLARRKSYLAIFNRIESVLSIQQGVVDGPSQRIQVRANDSDSCRTMSLRACPDRSRSPLPLPQIVS
jgi:hypothetical protein